MLTRKKEKKIRITKKMEYHKCSMQLYEFNNNIDIRKLLSVKIIFIQFSIYYSQNHIQSRIFEKISCIDDTVKIITYFEQKPIMYLNYVNK